MPARNQIIAQPSAAIGPFQEQHIDAACVSSSVVERATGQIQWDALDSRFPYHPDAPKKHSSYKYQNVSGERWGSGTLIGYDLFLTGAHCVQPQNGNGWVTPYHTKKDQQLSAERMVRLMHVNFNYQHTTCRNDSVADLLSPPTHNEESFAIVELVEYGFRIGDSPLDYAIVRLTGNPGFSYGFAEISISPLALGARIYIWQHPKGQPKKLAAGQYLGVSSEDPAIINHNANTEGGSSGAGAAINEKTIFSVHIQGDSKTGINSATRMSAIYMRSPTIQRIVEQQNQNALAGLQLQQETKPDHTALKVAAGVGIGMFALWGLYKLSQSAPKSRSAPGPGTRISSAAHIT